MQPYEQEKSQSHKQEFTEPNMHSVLHLMKLDFFFFFSDGDASAFLDE